MLVQHTIRYGFGLIVLGLASYFLTSTPSNTALIPAAFGVPILICGFVARNEARRKHALHVTSLLALLGIFGTVSGLLKLPGLLIGNPVPRPGAVIAQSIMAVASMWYFWLCLQSFIEARRRRRGV
jgi:O-antigen/teichoic acid export membrane protein